MPHCVRNDVLYIVIASPTTGGRSNLFANPLASHCESDDRRTKQSHINEGLLHCVRNDVHYFVIASPTLGGRGNLFANLIPSLRGGGTTTWKSHINEELLHCVRNDVLYIVIARSRNETVAICSQTHSPVIASPTIGGRSNLFANPLASHCESDDRRTKQSHINEGLLHYVRNDVHYFVIASPTLGGRGNLFANLIPSLRGGGTRPWQSVRKPTRPSLRVRL